MQGEPEFWNNQDKAQKTIQAQKTLNALLKPYEEVTAAINDVNALAELSEEDPVARSRTRRRSRSGVEPVREASS